MPKCLLNQVCTMNPHTLKLCGTLNTRQFTQQTYYAQCRLIYDTNWSNQNTLPCMHINYTNDT